MVILIPSSVVETEKAITSWKYLYDDIYHRGYDSAYLKKQFHDTVSPNIPENHDTKINFCLFNQKTKTNLFLALSLKIISMWWVSYFILKR